MFTLTFQFTPKVLKGVNEELASFYGVRINQRTLKKLVKENLRFLDGIDFQGHGFNSTGTREEMLEAISELVGAGHWPTFGEGQGKAFERFHAKFKRLAKRHGVRVDQ